MDRLQNIKNLLLLSSKVSNFCIGMEGNISAKIDNGLIIKASGTKLNSLIESDLVEFNMNGEQMSNFDKRGSMELGFHLFLLGFEGINYVSHTHPTSVLKILCSDFCELFSTERIFPDQVVFNGEKSCLVPYVKPGNDLAKVMSECVNSFIYNEGYFPKLILLKNHGIVTCGETIDECIISTEICEKSAEIFIDIINIGPKFLSKSEIFELSIDKNEKYRQELLK